MLVFCVALGFGIPLYAADEVDTSELEVEEPAGKAHAPDKGSTSDKAQKPEKGQKAEKPGKKGNPSVLDLEAELIEGERKAPDLFFQLQPGTPNLDAILFQRTNFNDFHDLEKRFLS